jgi:hypothetical protein
MFSCILGFFFENSEVLTYCKVFHGLLYKIKPLFILLNGFCEAAEAQLFFSKKVLFCIPIQEL